MNATTFLDGRVTMLLGDVRAILKTLPDDHFDCVVTSPPYWGLRDYGTAAWQGGDAGCDHAASAPSRRENSVRSSTLEGGKDQIHRSHQFKGNCQRCGAVRVDHQIGLEPTLSEHLAVMVEVFEEVRRVLKPTGTLWLNYGDCYATSPNGRSAADTKATGNDDRTFRDKPFSTIGGVLKAKDLCMIPNRLAIALQEAGWWVRSEIIWHKPNPMPESIKDRPGTSHEKVWLLAKRERYYYDADAIAEPVAAVSIARVSQNDGNPVWNGNRERSSTQNPQTLDIKKMVRLDGMRNSRNVWTIGTSAFPEAHFATFPTELAERCIKAGSAIGGHILDPFGGSGTSALVAAQLGRRATLIELNPEYAALARARIEAAFMGKEEGSRHMVKKLGKDKLPFEPGSLFANIGTQRQEVAE